MMMGKREGGSGRQRVEEGGFGPGKGSLQVQCRGEFQDCPFPVGCSENHFGGSALEQEGEG